MGATKATLIGTAVASLASVVAGARDARAAIVTVSNRPVSLTWPGGSSAYWDVDGDNTDDFRLWNNATGATVYLDLSSSVNGRGILGSGSTSTKRVDALGNGFVVGPAPVGFTWKNPIAYRTLVGPGGSIGGSYGFIGGFQEGDNYFGFRFGNPASPYYGYAVLNFGPLASGSRTVTISSWAYNDVAGAPITVSSSNPVPAPIGLAGLAAGAAWTRRLRRRIRASAKTA